MAKSYKPSGAPNVTAGKTIKKQFNRDDMNNLIDWIKEMAKLGGKVTSPTPSISHETGDFLTADKMKEII